MNVRVLLHVRFLVEPLPAVLARVGPGVGVDEEVRRQSAGPLKGLPTLLALEHLFDAVHGPGSGWFIRLETLS